MATFLEKLAMAVSIDTRFAGMDRYGMISFSAWPHVDGDGFSHNETCYEATCAYCGDFCDAGARRGEGKTYEEALDNLLKQMATSVAKRQANRIRNIAGDANEAKRCGEIVDEIKAVVRDPAL